MPKLRIMAADLAASIFDKAISVLTETPRMATDILANGDPGTIGNLDLSNLIPLDGIWNHVAGTGTSGQSVVDAFVYPIIDALKPTGYALVMLFFIISLVELAMSERMTLEYMIKYFSKLVIGYAAVYWSDEIYDKVRSLGVGLTNFIGGYGGMTSTAYTDALQEPFEAFVENGGAASWIPLLAASLLIGGFILLISFAVMAAVFINIFTWVLEMGVRGIFLPVACALLSDDGWRGAGGRYLKKFLGVCSQGMVMTAVMLLLRTVVTGVVNSLTDNLAESLTSDAGAVANCMEFIGSVSITSVILIAIMIAGVGVMMKSMSIVSDVFGG